MKDILYVPLSPYTELRFDLFDNINKPLKVKVKQFL